MIKVSENQKKSISKNSLYYLIYSVLNVVFPFMTGIYVARILLPDLIGEVEAARNIAQYFVILSFLGIPTYGLREISKIRDDRKKLSKLFSELIVINTISTLVFLLLYLVLIFSVPVYRAELPLYLIVGVSIALNLLDDSWLFEGVEEFDFISLRNIVFKIVSFVLLVVLVKKPDDYLIYAAITVVGTSGNVLFNVFHTRKFVRFTLHGLELKKHLKPIFSLVVVNLAIEIYSLVDITMLKLMANNECVTYYSYGSKFYKIMLQIINSFTYVVVPRLSLLYKEENKEGFNQLLSKTFRVLLLLSLPMIIGIWFVSDYLITKIYGANYVESSMVLKVLCFILVASPVSYLLGSRVLLVSGNEKKMIYAVGVGAIVNVVLNACLIPFYKQTGATIASVTSECIVLVVYLLFSHKYFRLINIKKGLINEFVALLLMTAYLVSTLFIPFPNDEIKVILQILLAVFVYSLALVLLKDDIVMSYINKLLRRFHKK